MKIRTLIVAGLVAGSMTITGAALADGPGGSNESEDDPTTQTVEQDNEVSCGSNNDVNGFDVYVGANGFETCSDEEGAAIQGRVAGGENESGYYLTVDGDHTNRGQNDSLGGYILLRSDGTIGCGPAEGGDATDADATATPEGCQPGE